MIPANHKFACYAIRNTFYQARQDIFGVGDGITISTHPPFEIDEHWIEWMGTLTIERLKEANFTVLAVLKSDQPGVIDSENLDLMKHVEWFVYALVMHGVPYNNQAIKISGANHEGRIGARQVALPDPFVYMRDFKALKITQEILQDTSILFKKIRYVNSESDLYKRMKRGLGYLIRGLREKFSEDRIHMFVRSLEALLKPDRGATARQFTHRCQNIVGPSEENKLALEDIYQMRSYIEHLHNLQEKYPTDSETELGQRIDRRAFQAEKCAAYAYRQILADSKLLSYFNTDSNIHSLWAMQDHEKNSIWNGDLSLEKIADDHYIGNRIH